MWVKNSTVDDKNEHLW